VHEEPILPQEAEAESPETIDLTSDLLLDEERLPEKQYCVFRAGRERFCFSVLEVEEVVEWLGVTRVPRAPGFLMGIFNLRGSIIPVVDIALTEGRRPDLPPRHVVVAHLPGDESRDDLRLGVAADEVFGTFTTSEPVVLAGAPREIPHCCGMLRHESRLALALDLKRLVEAFPVPVI
jgi:purine-binding chemotaxis protein CheW